jgi:hypothetical protein
MAIILVDDHPVERVQDLRFPADSEMPNDYRSACIKNLLASLNLLEITVNRLTEVIQTNQTGGNSVLPKRVTMAYNALGQRTQLARFQSTGSTNPVATTDYTYDTANVSQMTD